MTQVPEELAAILNEIDKALNAKLYYLAIAVALSVPDVCACLEFDPDKPSWANDKTYSAWCDAHLAFNKVAGMDLYRLRCGILHRGNFEHKKSKFDRVIFISPESHFQAHDVIVTVAAGVKFGGIEAEKLGVSGLILHLGVVPFCRAITDAARKWSIAKAADPFVQRNLPNLVRYRPNGIPPYSVGFPAIA